MRLLRVLAEGVPHCLRLWHQSYQKCSAAESLRIFIRLLMLKRQKRNVDQQWERLAYKSGLELLRTSEVSWTISPEKKSLSSIECGKSFGTVLRPFGLSIHCFILAVAEALSLSKVLVLQMMEKRNRIDGSGNGVHRPSRSALPVLDFPERLTLYLSSSFPDNLQF
jgi:hypothetical protein